MSDRRIALCGGTFDPFHRGHLDPLLEVRDLFGWSELVFVPAYKQPFKTERETSSPFDRFAMAVLATEDEAAMRVSALELERGAISYTVDTLEALHRDDPAASLEWIIGDDNTALLAEWRSPERLFELANFVVLRRGGNGEVPAKLAGRVSSVADRPRSGAIVLASNRIVPVSSTEIRRRVRAGESIEGLVDPRVARYIERNRLYRREER